VETGAAGQLLRRPRHPYTRALLDTSSAVTLDNDEPAEQLPTIAGSVPAAGSFPAGCPFRNRCPRADDTCATMPPLAPLDGQLVACWHPVPVDEEWHSTDLSEV
jgi:oligopeptide/dipeptide ABC transporter ATP-binding protein